MGSSYSSLKVYLLCKSGTYGIPKNKQTKDQNPKTEENQKYFVTVKEENYDKCVNFEKVTHTIKFGKNVDPLYYNVLLYDGYYKDNGKDKGKNVFGYYYPSTKNEVLKELHVYYSVIDPYSPLVVSFVTKGDQTHNYLYSSLSSISWVRAYSIAYYSFGKKLTKEHLTKEFRKSHRNRKIKFEIGKNVVDVSGYKKELDNGTYYRYIYYPNGDTSVLGSECLFNFNMTSSKPECPKSPDDSKSAETPKPAKPAASTQEQPKSPNYDNKIDPYYLDFVNGHHYDGVILYYVKNENKAQKPSNGNNNNIQPGSNGQNSANGANESNGQGKKQNDNYDDNMAVLLELINNCNTKTHIKRKDKNGNWWSQEEVKYNDDDTLKKSLKEIKDSADKIDSTTFILEMKAKYNGVSVSDVEKDKTTYTKYTHKTTATNIKTNLLFRKNETKINNFDPSNLNTISLDIYFLKFGGTEQDWPFIIMFTYENKSQTGLAQPQAAPAAQAGDGNGSASSPPQSPAPAAPQPAGGGGGEGKAANGPKPCKKCYFSSENYEFKDWEELKNDVKKDETEEKKTKEKEKQEDQGEELEKKLTKKLEKIEQYGRCQTELYLLRKVAFYVLSTEDPKPEKIEEIKKETRPEVRPFIQMGTGTSLPVVLGSVAGGLVVLGTISAIIYGIYWYNTTIKLLT